MRAAPVHDGPPVGLRPLCVQRVGAVLLVGLRTCGIAYQFGFGRVHHDGGMRDRLGIALVVEIRIDVVADGFHAQSKLVLQVVRYGVDGQGVGGVTIAHDDPKVLAQSHVAGAMVHTANVPERQAHPNGEGKSNNGLEHGEEGDVEQGPIVPDCTNSWGLYF